MIKCPICSNKAHNVFYDNLYDDRYGFQGYFQLLKCKVCTHVFLNKKFTEDEIIHLYSNYYPRSNHGSELTINDFDMLSLNTTATSLVPQNVKVLDIGCGSGVSLLYHKSRGCEAWGVEADRNILRFAEKNDLNVKAGVFNPGDFLPKYFDYVTLDQVLEHTPDPVHTLQQVSLVLKNDGKCVFTCPNRSGWGIKVFGKKWLHLHVPYHLQHFSKKSINIALKKAGFKCESMKTITNQDWLYYQGLHLLMYPKIGQKSDYWLSSSKGFLGIRKFLYNILLRLHELNILRFISRQMDKLCLGDNIIIVAKFENKDLV